MKKIESVLNDNRCVGSFDTLLKMRDEKVQEVGDCILDQWSGKSVKDKQGSVSKKSGSKYSGVFDQITKGCLVPSTQSVSMLIYLFLLNINTFNQKNHTIYRLPLYRLF